MGWNAAPTARNARCIDIIAYNANASHFIGVQVETLSKRNPVPIGSKLDNIMGDFWVIVTNAVQEPLAFVMAPSEVKEMVHRGEKDGRISYWLQPSSNDKDEFREAWDRIGYVHK